MRWKHFNFQSDIFFSIRQAVKFLEDLKKTLDLKLQVCSLNCRISVYSSTTRTLPIPALNLQRVERNVFRALARHPLNSDSDSSRSKMQCIIQGELNFSLVKRKLFVYHIPSKEDLFRS